MKHHFPRLRSHIGQTLAFLAIAWYCSVQTVAAQTTAFTYQGRLTDGPDTATGLYDMNFSLFAVGSGGTPVSGPLTTNGVAVSNGLFTVTLDFGTSAFPGADRWLEISVQTNGGGAFTTLSPRQKVTAAPYAVTARNLTGVLPSANLSGTYPGAVTLNNAGNSFSGNGAGLTGVNATTLGGVNSSGFWRTIGNSGTTAANFVGTTDNQPLELRANGQRALLLIPGITGFGVSVVAGSNTIEAILPNVAPAATIAGGHNNLIRSGGFYSTIGGGKDNFLDFSAQQVVIAGGIENRMGISANSSAIGGGWQNMILSNTVMSTIAGGWTNTVGPFGTASTIGGGYQNSIQLRADYSTIGGGRFNRIGISNEYAIISGGAFNEIQKGALDSAIGGGFGNTIGTNAQTAVIAGGGGNRIEAVASAIGGGGGNRIETNARNSVISGGNGNRILAGAEHSTIAGGLLNVINTNATFAFIGGGSNNDIQSNTMRATITGGSVNWIQTGSDYSAISGGQLNTIAPGCSFSTIGGGKANIITNLADYATVPGGGGNIAGGHFSFAAGREAHALHHGSFVWADFSTTVPFISTADNQFLIRAAGGVGIGTTTPGFALHVNGTAGKPGGGSWSVASDARLKKNIRPLASALDKLLALHGVSFEYMDPAKLNELSGERMGLVAQEVEKVFPDWVETGPDGYKRVTVRGLEALVVEALRELQQKQDSRLTEELKRRDADNAELRQRLEKLERLVSGKRGGTE